MTFNPRFNSWVDMPGFLSSQDKTLTVYDEVVVCLVGSGPGEGNCYIS